MPEALRDVGLSSQPPFFPAKLSLSRLDSAAAIWATSAVGPACGLGLWQIALAGTALTFVAFQVLGPLTPYIRHREGENAD